MKAITYFLCAAVYLFPCTAFPADLDTASLDTPHWEKQRKELVESLQKDGITDERVLTAMRTVLRHEFVPELMRVNSYADRPLPIGMKQTISQPYIVAYMCQALQIQPTDTVLEIGTGSGYHAAVLSHLAAKVYTIEIIPELGIKANKLLELLGYSNVEILIGDGYLGWPEAAPFDCVILTAAPTEIPQPLIDQLKPGGRLVAPVGEYFQELVRITLTDGEYVRESLLPVRFVPMTGEAQTREAKDGNVR